VEFLVEVADPPEAAEFGYTVNGLLLSDFFTPQFYDPVAADGVRYSFGGHIPGPRQILRGGYISWHEPVSDHWWQQIWFGTPEPRFRDLGKLTARNGSFTVGYRRPHRDLGAYRAEWSPVAAIC